MFIDLLTTLHQTQTVAFTGRLQDDHFTSNACDPPLCDFASDEHRQEEFVILNCQNHTIRGPAFRALQWQQ
jgi:hypothetical protein